MKDPTQKDMLNHWKEQWILEANRRFDLCIQDLVHAYENHMSSIIPQPQLLDVRVSLVVVSKGILIQNVVIKPHETVEDVK